MKFASTRNPGLEVSFKEAVFTGLAPDGGLYNPTSVPNLSDIYGGFYQETPFLSMAEKMTAGLFEEELDREGAQRICRRAFSFSPRVTRVNDSISMLELYHGPSCAFKDFGASFLASSMEEFLQEENQQAVILTATSGDTGSAVARAFYGKKNIEVVILYPSGRVSPLQEKQLTTLGGNIAALEVQGNFDDCQRMVKEAFVDEKLNSRLTLTSANSINLGRLIPQSFYYVYAYSMLKESPDHDPGAVYFTVPSGNFGNLTAGILAWKWGLPVERFIAATNINDVVPEYLKTSVFTPRPSVKTHSNAMDVGDPSNFERMKAIFHQNWEEMREIIAEEVVTDTETEETIARVYKEKGRMIDPHTAVGYLASERFIERYGLAGISVITLSTAHPGKFLEIVEKSTGKAPELPEQLKKVLELKKHSVVIENTLKDLSNFLLKNYS